MISPTVAVVGAGISGLTCASILAANGHKVTVFDKGRSPGGRLASRDRDANTFDYGAQYFTARSSRFRQFLAPLVNSRKAARWDGRFARMEGGCLTEESISEARYVGVPQMRSIVDALASSLDCRSSHQVTSVFRQSDQWLITAITGDEPKQLSCGAFDFLVLSLPPAQAAALHPNPELSAFKFRPCVALLLAFSDSLKLEFDGIKIDDQVISWVARDSSKPGRKPGERWVIHASPDWSEKHFQEDSDELERLLTEQYATIFDINLPYAHFAKLHKWRYALPVSPTPSIRIFDHNSCLAYCGDWCSSARVEGAFLSGLSAAQEIILAQSL